MPTSPKSVQPLHSDSRGPLVAGADSLADDYKARNEFVITRVCKVTPNGNIDWHWRVYIRRQARFVTRTFADTVYGNEETAKAYARAYRDAALRLIPPESRAQRRNKIRSTSRSGISGVRREHGPYGAFWIASYCIDRGRNLTKRFSVKRHGNDRAKALAIAAREDFMRLNNDSFLARDEHALDVPDVYFGDLLQPEGSDLIEQLHILNEHSIDYRLHELDQWFDTLCPLFVHVKIFPAMNGGRQTLRIYLSNGGLPPIRRQSTLSLGRAPLKETLDRLWTYLGNALIDMHDLQCWKEFDAKYREAIFALDPAQGFYVRYRYDNADYALRCTPPASLAGLLPDFQVPTTQQLEQ